MLRIGCIALAVLLMFAPALSAARTIRIVSLYDGSYSNDAWNRRHESARAAAVTHLSEEGYDVSSALEQSISSERIFERYLYHTSQGADIIISTNFVHRDGFLNYTKTVQGSRQYFITGAALGAPTNFTFSVYGNVFSAAYLAGKACGLVTTTNSVGVVAVAGTRGGNAQVNAFSMGVKSVNPSAKVIMMQSSTTANNSVVERYIALDMVDNHKVDCMLAGPTAPGAYVVAAQRPNVSLIGLYEDFRYTFGENVLFSILYDWTSLYLDGIHGYLNGTFPGRRQVWGPLGSTVVLSDYSTKVSPVVARVLDESKRRLINGNECIFPWESFKYIYAASELANTILVFSEDNTTSIRCLSQLQIQNMPAFMLATSPFNTVPVGAPNAFVIINPRNWTADDVIIQQYPEYSNPGAILFIVLSVLGLLTCIGCIIFVTKFRFTPIIKATSPIFMFIILGGCVFMFCSVFMFYGAPTTASCHLRIWLFFTGYSLAMSALLVKNWRIWRIFSNDSMSIFAIKSSELLLYGVLPTLVVMTICLILWTVLNPYHLVYDTYTPNLGDDHVNLRCVSQDMWSTILVLVISCLLLLATVLISLLNRNLGYTIFRETRQVALSSYNTVIVAVGCLIITFAAPYSVWLEANVQAGAVTLIAWGLLLFIFVERMKVVLIDGKSGFESSSGMSSTSHTKSGDSSKRSANSNGSTAREGRGRTGSKQKKSGGKSEMRSSNV
jgi:basic membrane lipoprotein Med (substrate-binding protein (PBP1-ABC) superfamily)